MVTYEKKLSLALSKSFLERLYAKILSHFKISPKAVELHLVASASMKVLNKRFRQQDKTTDVLSFSTRDPELLGSVVIDVKTAIQQARFYRHSKEREALDLFIHGVLHLLGLDHQTKKEAKQMGQFEKYFGGLLAQINPSEFSK